MSHIRVDLPNTNNKWVEFELANVDTFIIRVGFRLANVETIHTLTRHEHDPLTRITTSTAMLLERPMLKLETRVISPSNSMFKPRFLIPSSTASSANKKGGGDDNKEEMKGMGGTKGETSKATPHLFGLDSLNTRDSELIKSSLSLSNLLTRVRVT